MHKLRLAILGSTRGSAMQALIDAINTQQLDASIDLVLSNKKDAFILARGTQHGLCVQWLDDQQQGQLFFEQQLSVLLHQYRIDLLVLIGYMRILSPSFVHQWPGKIINVHPSLLPFFAGLRDLEVHQAVLDQRLNTTGCSVHYVTEVVDGGLVLVQKNCSIEAGDTVETIKIKVQRLEGEALIEAVRLLHRQSLMSRSEPGEKK